MCCIYIHAHIQCHVLEDVNVHMHVCVLYVLACISTNGVYAFLRRPHSDLDMFINLCFRVPYRKSPAMLVLRKS